MTCTKTIQINSELINLWLNFKNLLGQTLKKHLNKKHRLVSCCYETEHALNPLTLGNNCFLLSTLSHKWLFTLLHVVARNYIQIIFWHGTNSQLLQVLKVLCKLDDLLRGRCKQIVSVCWNHCIKSNHDFQKARLWKYLVTTMESWNHWKCI